LLTSLKKIQVLLGMTPRELMRPKDAEKAGANDLGLDDDTLIAMLVANPVVPDRPLVLSGDKAKIGPTAAHNLN
jgi:arsenate reductase